MIKNIFTKNVIIRNSILTIFICFISSINVFAQNLVTGTVIGEDGQGIPGTTVLVKGSKVVVSTDIKGYYKITVGTLNDTLIFKSIGFITKNIPIKGKLIINVKLEEEIKQLKEVVSIGYQTVKKNSLNGAVSVVDIDEINKTPQLSATDALLGRVPGVSVKTSAQPGDGGSIFIRGVSSFNLTSNPLYVIDGIPTSDATDLNPNDIESIQVLKDASAAAIYGSRAMNGVIVITTKKGKKDGEKLEFSYKTGISNVSKRFNMMQTPEWMAYNDLRWKNKYADDPDPTSYLQFMPIVKNPSINTNWQDLVYQTGTTNDYNLATSGGNENINYRLSGNYFSQKGIVIGPSFDRYNCRINGGWKKGRIKINESISLGYTHSIDQGDGAWSEAYGMVPVVPPHDSLGHYALSNYNLNTSNSSNATSYNTNTNLLATRDKTVSTSNVYHVLANISPEFTIFPFLKYKVNIGIDISANYNETDTKAELTSIMDKPISGLLVTRPLSQNKLIEHLLNFNKKFGKHSISAVAGFTQQTWKSTGDNVYETNILQDNGGQYYYTLSNGSVAAGSGGYVNGDIQLSALRSYLCQVVYDYDDKYFLTASFRRDGSSKFSPEARWGNFPSVSPQWLINKEKFFKNIKPFSFISELKLWASYGILGNSELSPWQYKEYNQNNAIYMFGPNQTINNGSINMALVDQNIKWESKISSGVGAELYMFHNKLGISCNYYDNMAVNLLLDKNVALYTGQTPSAFVAQPSIWTNVGSVRNSGFETSIIYKNYDHLFKYNLTINLTTLKNKILKTGNGELPWNAQVTYTESDVGHPIGEFYLLKSNGLYQIGDPDLETLTVLGVKQKPGDPKFVDENGDHNIDANDRVYCGNPWPKLEHSINFNCSYRNFDFTMFWYGDQGRTVYCTSEEFLNDGGSDGNYRAGLLADSWTPENPNASQPRPEYHSQTIQYSDKYLQDGSFLRLKTIQIGYTFDHTKINKLVKIGFTKIHVDFSIDNVLTITKYTGLDPDFRGILPLAYGYDGNTYPPARTFYFGVQLSF